MAVERLDKIISKSGKFTRSEVKRLARNGEITLNGEAVKDVSVKADTENCVITVSGELIDTAEHVYIMLNKPQGVVSASEGRGDITVVDILPDDMKRKNLFPAGRLDKDTTGFVLITDDGDFAHRILSPKNHIKKTYIAALDKPIDESKKSVLESGIELKDGTVFRPAELEFIDGDMSNIKITIFEGKYHQIKRMFKAVGSTVVSLKRIKMGNVFLDDTLKEGCARYLTSAEIEEIEKR